MNEDLKFNTKQASSYLCLAEQTLINWRHKRKGPDYILLGKKIIYLQSDLDNYLESHKLNNHRLEAGGFKIAD